MWFCGVDVGSISTEVVLVSEDGQVVAASIGATGADSIAASERALREALAAAGIGRDRLGRVVSTGYGRDRVPFATDRVTEITCHARGAIHLFPRTRTVIDIGGQDSKVIRVDDAGRVMNFQMNDKCAAGTGRFLEVMARALEVDLVQLGPLGLLGSGEVSVSSTCTVFAESEVVGLIHQGLKREDIIRGIHAAVAGRTRALVGRVGVEPEVTMTGGVAKNPGVVKELADRIGAPMNIPAEPQTVGALGAALIAKDKGK